VVSEGFGTFGTGEPAGIGPVTQLVRNMVGEMEHRTAANCSLEEFVKGRFGTPGTADNRRSGTNGTFGTGRGSLVRETSEGEKAEECARWWTKLPVRGSQVMDEVLSGWFRIKERVMMGHELRVPGSGERMNLPGQSRLAASLTCSISQFREASKG